MLKTKAGPPDGVQRLMEERQALIRSVENTDVGMNGSYWRPARKGLMVWKMLYIHHLKYASDIPITYPATAPETAVPELEGKIAEMYRDGEIRPSPPLKAFRVRNVPKFGPAQLTSLGLVHGWQQESPV